MPKMSAFAQREARLLASRLTESMKAMEAKPERYACPDGERCTDPECVAENQRRSTRETPR